MADNPTMHAPELAAQLVNLSCLHVQLPCKGGVRHIVLQKPEDWKPVMEKLQKQAHLGMKEEEDTLQEETQPIGTLDSVMGAIAAATALQQQHFACGLDKSLDTQPVGAEPANSLHPAVDENVQIQPIDDDDGALQPTSIDIQPKLQGVELVGVHGAQLDAHPSACGTEHDCLEDQKAEQRDQLPSRASRAFRKSF